jgi:P27 family predicted phage terminase small subunit
MRGRKPSEIAAGSSPVLDVPRPPSWLAKEAKAEWRKVAPILVERNVLTEGDLGALAAYCDAIGQLVAANAIIAAEGMVVGGKKHPLITTTVAARNQIRQLAAELGLTPISRSRPAVREDAEPDDDWMDA